MNSDPANLNNHLLNTVDLKTHFLMKKKIVRAVDGVSFNLNKGTTLGIVGESGCGKSITALSILRLIQIPPGRIAGQIMFGGRDILQLSEKEIRQIRGAHISMIFQEPMVSLNPVFTIGQQLEGVIKLHQKLSPTDVTEKACEMLHKVGIPDPKKRLKSYPHQLSGGMRQRVMIAMAISSNPLLLIADEPTTALDVTIQAQVVDLLARLKEESDLSILFITHDLDLISEITQEVMVMYAGKIVEQAPVNLLFDSPLHPYTHALLSSIPQIELRSQRLSTIPGFVPDLSHIANQCRFASRCQQVDNVCGDNEPPLVEVAPNHKVRCWKQNG